MGCGTTVGTDEVSQTRRRRLRGSSFASTFASLRTARLTSSSNAGSPTRKRWLLDGANLETRSAFWRYALAPLILSAIIATSLFALADHHLPPQSVTDWISLSIYFLTGFIIIQLIVRERSARTRSRLSETRYRELVESSQDLLWSVDLNGRSTDLTERRLREDALQLFRSLMEQSADGILILDGATHTILDVNETFCRWLDYTREELKGGTTERVVCPHPRMSWEERVAEVHRLGHRIDPNAAPRMIEVEYRRRDGTRVPREVGFQYVAVQEHELIVVVARDVSERRRLELQLHQAQKMEGIGRLAGGIAHDFNNVLTAIVGYTGMARAALPPNHAAVADLDEVRRAAERASALTRQLLAFARKQIIQPQLVSINQLLDGVEPMLKPLIGEDIVLTVLTASDLWLVSADPSQVQQIVLNLAVNARDAMPSGGTLTFETANVVLGAEYARAHPDVAPGEYVRLAVTDTGIGMDEQVQQHIFEPFFTTKERGRGTGLGLATTHGIVRQSGGHIWLYSEPGRGTTFKIYLPRATEGVTPLPRVEAPLARPGWETVLVVEDEAMVRRFAVSALERLGYRALEAPNGETALETAAAFTGPIHLLFTDVVMPHMNGHELATRIRERQPDVRVLYASGYTDNTIVHQGVLEPGLAFLQKPYTAVELSAKVREVLDAPVECLT